MRRCLEKQERAGAQERAGVRRAAEKKNAQIRRKIVAFSLHLRSHDSSAPPRPPVKIAFPDSFLKIGPLFALLNRAG